MKACMIVVALALLGVASARLIRDTAALEILLQGEEDLTDNESVKDLNKLRDEVVEEFKTKVASARVIRDAAALAILLQSEEDLTDNESVKDLNKLRDEVVEAVKAKGQ